MIFVTGGTGLVGSHLLFELVLSGKKVIALKRETSDIEKTRKVFSYYSDKSDELFSKIDWINGDILDYDSIENSLNGVEEIYHAAALVSFNPKEKYLVKSNIHGTQNLVNAALEKKIQKFCFVSSVASLGKPLNGNLINESCIWSAKHKKSIYSYSKHHSEMEVWRGAAEGLNVVIVNPSIILGPGFWNSGSSAFFSTIYKGLNFYPSGITGFLDVRDVVKIMIELMEKEIFNERFILNAENYAYKDFFQLIAKSLNVKKPAVPVTKFMTSVGWRMAKIISIFSNHPPKLTKETAKSANSVSYYSNEKITQKLNYNFISIKDSIRENCELFLDDKN
ncbi:NAD-dependent epimerase/dehydratase family protein [Bacteroidota bacterium]